MRKLKQQFLLCLMALLTLNSYAAQYKTVKHTETLTIDLSIKDPNVISVKNDRIASHLVAKNAIAGSVDNKTGIFSLKPTSMYYEKPFSMVIFTEKGYRYTIIVNPKSIPAQDIVLSNRDTKTVNSSKSNVVINDASRLIRSMIRGVNLEGYNRQYLEDKGDKKSYLDGKSKYQLLEKYSGSKLSGEVVIFTNNLNKNLKVKEEGFYSLNVVAVSLSSFTLSPKESLKIYRVVKNG